MPDFDDEYAKTDNMFYGAEPSAHLELFVRTERIVPGLALDIGCGDGRNSLYLAQLGFNVTGFDISEVAISRLKHIAFQKQLKIEALVADARTYQYSGKRFRLVVANTILDHLEQQEAYSLVHDIKEAIDIHGYLFVAVFTTEDPGFSRHASESNTAQFVRHYFAPDELRDCFSDLTIIRYHEELCLDTHHGPEHYHCIARLMARRE